MRVKQSFLTLIGVLVFLFQTNPVSAQKAPNASGLQVQELVYKTIDTVQLKLRIYSPEGAGKSKPLSTIVFFFGGGWSSGSMDQFEEQAKHFAGRGMVAVLADYRVAKRHNTSPFEAVHDAKSALRYVRANSQRLNIDPNRIAASGGSAGGHLAAAADLTQLDEPNENKAVSSRPNVLVLFNPVFDNGPDGYGYERVKERYQEISPMHNIRKGAAPTLVLLGTKDHLIPVKTAQLYKQKLEAVGTRCDLILYENQPHGFFNYKKKDKEYYQKTLQAADDFLTSLGYLKPQKVK
ncbi:alpha/beta hydrolase [Rufibacter quisquiliarum]|uniref:Acetyl esterase/lipase n=1 Tax=Rufibacter quisquiliarum TaxID=1549639 RepID=A0A839GW37_9BACT|nr:alpha/beta hydrolase [Rufibacter quisquiliarum]MBA9078638.1 acetyl esterase/lipase [Rufibacter quisquiliarum]